LGSPTCLKILQADGLQYGYGKRGPVERLSLEFYLQIATK
jgi:hypothetical protein